ncbi:12375_t:CDS:2, partial [Racocetra fulgida]
SPLVASINNIIQAWDHDSQKRSSMSLISNKLYNLYSLIKKSCEGSSESHNENVIYEMQTNSNSIIKEVSDEDFASDLNQAEAFHAQRLFSKAFPIFKKFAQMGNKPKNMDYVLHYLVFHYLKPVARNDSLEMAIFMKKNMDIGHNLLKAAHNHNHKNAATTLQQLEQDNGQDITAEFKNDAIVELKESSE